jgi:hypothetical protein
MQRKKLIVKINYLIKHTLYFCKFAIFVNLLSSLSLTALRLSSFAQANLQKLAAAAARLPRILIYNKFFEKNKSPSNRAAAAASFCKFA